MPRRASRWIAGALAAAACASVGCGDDRDLPSIEAMQRTDNATRLATARTKLAGLDADWRAAVDAVDPTTVVGNHCAVFDDDAGALATTPANPEWGSWDIGPFPLPVPKGIAHDLSRTPFPVTFVPVGASLPAASPESRATIAHFTAGDHEAQDKLTTTDALVQLTAATPGHVEAKVWVYDHVHRQIVCAGLVSAGASTAELRGSLQPSDDLLANVMRALPTSLHVVAPAARAPTGDHVIQLGGPTSDPGPALTLGQVYEVDGVLRVRLASTAKPGCDDQKAVVGPRLIFDIPRGPADAFWTGAPFGVAASGLAAELGAPYVTITAHVDSLAPGARVHGTIDTSGYGRGTFEATMCAGVDASHLHTLPRAAPAGSLRGTIDHKAFAWQSAIAVVENTTGTEALAYIDLFARAGVTCETHEAHEDDPRLRLGEIGGASEWANLVGTPQPAEGALRVRAGSDDVELGIDKTWVQLDALTLEPGKRITGKALIWTPESSIGGTFRAVVCDRNGGDY